MSIPLTVESHLVLDRSDNVLRLAANAAGRSICEGLLVHYTLFVFGVPRIHTHRSF